MASDLRAVIDAGTALAPSVVCDGARNVAESLAVLHAEGGVHGRLRPENVLLQPAGSGLRLVPEVHTYPVPAAMSGPAPADGYMAPEVRAGAPPSVASDLYALGVIVYELCCGETPFVGDGTGGAGGGIAGRNPAAHPQVSQCGVEPDDAVVPPRPACVPEPLWGLIERLLEHDPHHRPETAAEVADQLAVLTLTLAEDPPIPRTRRSTPEGPAARRSGGVTRSHGRPSDPEPQDRVYVITPDQTEHATDNGLWRAPALVSGAVGLVLLGAGTFGATWLSGRSGGDESTRTGVVRSESGVVPIPSDAVQMGSDQPGPARPVPTIAPAAVPSGDLAGQRGNASAR